MTEREDPVARVLAAYKAAVFAKDVDAFLALYDEDVYVFDMWGEWSYRGLDAWRRMVEGWFGSLGTERVGVDVAEVETIGAGDFLVAHASVTFRGLSAEGEELRSLQNRMTLALRRKDGVWKIVHEHTSAPVDFQTGKVILRR